MSTTPNAAVDIPFFSIDSSDARERGRQHGSLASTQIRASIDYYADLFERTHGLGWSRVRQLARPWQSIVSAYDVDQWEEVRGIAEGSDLDPLDILALNARGEMVYADYGKPDGCTAFALTPPAPGSHVFAGQNWDWRIGTAPSRIFLRIVQPPKPTIIMGIEAGQLGRHGANSAGLGLFTNGLPQGMPRAVGVPQPFIRRKILDQASFPDALTVSTAKGQQIAANLILADRQGMAIDIETSPDGHDWQFPEQGVLAHANHYEYATGAMRGRWLIADSTYRSWRVRQAATQLVSLTEHRVVLEGLKVMLSDRFGYPHAVCAGPSPHDPPHLQWGTLSSSIVDLTSGNWYLAAGEPNPDAYKILPWNLYEDTQ